MPHRSESLSMPASRVPATILAVDRAVSELRRGRIIALRGSTGHDALVQAAEAATPEALREIEEMGGPPPKIAITGKRAAVLKLGENQAKVVILTVRDGLTADFVSDLVEPLSALPLPVPISIAMEEAPPHGCESAAVGLTKVARLLPAAIVVELRNPDADDLAAWCARHDMLMVDAGDVFQYEHTASRTLRRVSEARVPLAGAEQTRIIAFRPLDGGLEHLAIIIGDPDPAEPVLTRLHSECFTGDLLGSLRCDCGDQLRAAIAEISRNGSGMLLYLAQEGRGIGLVNKLRAYELQDRGFDTIDANEQLGFDADERVYAPAAMMLRQLGVSRVRLMTNNPDKVSGLARWNVEVTERVSHSFPSNHHNEAYLRTKRVRGGHLF